MRFVVTGGAGFVGSHICLSLLNSGHEVICLDNLSSGSKQNMLAFIYNPLFDYVIHDITEPFPISNVDCVVHCATPSLKDPLHFLKTCSYGAFNVAGIARRNLSNIFCVLSSENESNEILDTGYSTMKEIFRNYSYLNTQLLEISGIYGERMGNSINIYSNILNKIMQAFLTKKDIEIPYTSDSLFNSMYISDFTSLFMGLCFNNLCKFKDLKISSKQNITFRDIEKIFKEKIDTPSKIIYGDVFLNKEKHFLSDSTCKKLNWKEKMSYSEGLYTLLKKD